MTFMLINQISLFIKLNILLTNKLRNKLVPFKSAALHFSVFP